MQAGIGIKCSHSYHVLTKKSKCCESETERFTMSVFRVVNHGKRFHNCSCANKWEWVSVTGSQIGLVTPTTLKTQYLYRIKNYFLIRYLFLLKHTLEYDEGSHLM